MTLPIQPPPIRPMTAQNMNANRKLVPLSGPAQTQVPFRGVRRMAAGGAVSPEDSKTILALSHQAAQSGRNLMEAKGKIPAEQRLRIAKEIKAQMDKASSHFMQKYGRNWQALLREATQMSPKVVQNQDRTQKATGGSTAASSTPNESNPDIDISNQNPYQLSSQLYSSNPINQTLVNALPPQTPEALPTSKPAFTTEAPLPNLSANGVQGNLPSSNIPSYNGFTPNLGKLSANMTAQAPQSAATTQNNLAGYENQALTAASQGNIPEYNLNNAQTITPQNLQPQALYSSPANTNPGMTSPAPIQTSVTPTTNGTPTPTATSVPAATTAAQNALMSAAGFNGSWAQFVAANGPNGSAAFNGLTPDQQAAIQASAPGVQWKKGGRVQLVKKGGQIQLVKKGGEVKNKLLKKEPHRIKRASGGTSGNPAQTQAASLGQIGAQSVTAPVITSGYDPVALAENLYNFSPTSQLSGQGAFAGLPNLSIPDNPNLMPAKTGGTQPLNTTEQQSATTALPAATSQPTT